MARWLLVIAVLASGCVTSETPAVVPSTECPPNADCLLPPETTARSGIPMPDLVPGTAFYFMTSGIYDRGVEEAIVVASRNASGYLFAGVTKEDLFAQVVWGREWSGPHTLGLDRVGRGASHFFEWPLYDGASWSFNSNVTVTARATQNGFRMASESGKATLSYEYAPKIGFVTRYHSSDKDPYLALDLTRVGKVREFTWYSAGPSVGASSFTPTPATLTVPAGFDAVIVSPGGTSGTIVIIPPAGAPTYTWQATGTHETWTYVSMPATEGRWLVQATPGPDPDKGAYVRAVAVKWTTGSIT